MSDYSKRYYPVFLDLGRRLAIVVGGGRVAERKVRTLIKYGADVAVISPDVTEGLLQLVTDGQISLEERPYVRGDLKGAFVVVCATDDEETNRAVYAEAEEEGSLVNVVDVPPLCNFIVPSIVNQGQLQIAISTGGAAPAVAKRLRKKLQEEYGDEWGEYVALLGTLRGIVMERISDPKRRKELFEAVADSDVLDRIRAGERLSAERIYEDFVQRLWQK